MITFDNLSMQQEITYDPFKSLEELKTLDELIIYLTSNKVAIIENNGIPLQVYLFIFQNRFQIWNDNDEVFDLICINEEFRYLASIGEDDIDEKIRLHICIEKDYFNCFKVLLDCFYPWGEDTCILAIQKNHIKYIQYLYEFYKTLWHSRHKEFPLTHRATVIAIEIGNIDVLQLIYEINGN